VKSGKSALNQHIYNLSKFLKSDLLSYVKYRFSKTMINSILNKKMSPTLKTMRDYKHADLDQETDRTIGTGLNWAEPVLQINLRWISR
jgi:hypothetical protein